MCWGEIKREPKESRPCVGHRHWMFNTMAKPKQRLVWVLPRKTHCASSQENGPQWLPQEGAKKKLEK